MYWYHNKINNEAFIFSSLTAITQTVGIEYETLIYHFSRKKRLEYKTDFMRIVRTDVISSKRK